MLPEKKSALLKQTILYFCVFLSNSLKNFHNAIFI